MNWLNFIEDLPPLKKGVHSDPSSGLCAMEMVAFMERLPHSDHPECTCPVIASFVRRANDSLNNEDRDKLLPLLPELVGTVSKAHEKERAEYFAWLAIHRWAPIALRAVGIDESFITRMEMAKTLKEAKDAAYAAADAAADAADAAAVVAAAAYAYADADANFDLADEYIKAIRGALEIGPKPKGFTSLERVPALKVINDE